MNPEVNLDLIVGVRNDLQKTLHKEIAALCRTIADQLIDIYTPNVATELLSTYTEYLEEDNESRLAFVVGDVKGDGQIGVNIRGLSRGGCVWFDLVKNADDSVHAVYDYARTLTVVELAPFLRLANVMKTGTATVYPTGTQTATR